MAYKRRQLEEEEEIGAPEWMVTFSDCMTLLLTFFVLLLSFSSFDDDIFRKLRVFFAKELCAVDPLTKEKESVIERETIKHMGNALPFNSKPMQKLSRKNARIHGRRMGTHAKLAIDHVKHAANAWVNSAER